ncbi:MAG: Omp28-related outer membrane protein [Bacteroidota bacterium]|nr:Omp28-related outer membrane protein [Bacteroidota bacterium]
MRTLISSILLGLILIGFYSCDKVKHPNIITQTAVGTTFDSINNSAVSGFKKTLLEDYTGHKCGNCPAAAILTENLSAQYQSSLVVIAIHAGFFAKINSEFPTSYTCAAGNDWDATTGFGVSAIGNPNGMVNRKVYPGFTLVHKDTWFTTVGLAQSDPFIVKMDLSSAYDKTARALNVTTKLTFLQASSNNIKLQLVLTEDSIIGSQLDYSQNPDHVEDYHFEHMLRTAINGSWGEVAKTAPIAALSTVTITNSNFAVDSKFNDKKLTLVAFVFDETTKEVLQVEKIKIRK